MVQIRGGPSAMTGKPIKPSLTETCFSVKWQRIGNKKKTKNWRTTQIEVNFHASLESSWASSEKTDLLGPSLTDSLFADGWYAAYLACFCVLGFRHQGVFKWRKRGASKIVVMNCNHLFLKKKSWKVPCLSTEGRKRTRKVLQSSSSCTWNWKDCRAVEDERFHAGCYNQNSRRKGKKTEWAAHFGNEYCALYTVVLRL